jgi:hypothetical protein
MIGLNKPIIAQICKLKFSQLNNNNNNNNNNNSNENNILIDVGQ